VEHCPDTGLFVGYVPGIAGAHSQAETLDELRKNLEEVLGMLLEGGDLPAQSDYVSTQQIVIP
jgi:predicted RNase H-like HicB family nuclease